MKRLLLPILLVPATVLAQTAAPSPPDTWLPRSTADLVLLEKLRAQPTDITIKAGQQANFGSLTIAVKSCATRPPDLPQNSAAFLEITDSRGAKPNPNPDAPAPTANAPVVVFRGWILSNTPAVSQLEHPIYDLRLVACR